MRRAGVASLVMLLQCLASQAHVDSMDAVDTAVQGIAPALSAPWQARLRPRGQQSDGAAASKSEQWAAESLQLRLLEAGLAELSTVSRPNWSRLAADAVASVLDRARAEGQVASAERAALLTETHWSYARCS